MELSRRALKIIVAVTGMSLLVTGYRFFTRLSSLVPVLVGLNRQNAGSIGVIGSADGPTMIFTTTRAALPLTWLYFLCSLAEVALHVFLLVKAVAGLRTKENDR